MAERPSVSKLLLVFLVPFFLTISLRGQAQEKQKKIIIGSAQSIVPLAQAFSARFQKQYPRIEIKILGRGSNYAVKATRRGEVDIGLIARSLNLKEKAELNEEAFGRDAIFLITYPGNPVSDLTLEQIRKIYLGQITNWREVRGQDKGIVPLTREKSSNIHAIFIRHLFGKSSGAQETAFTLRARKAKIIKTIKRIDGSIGYGILHFEQAKAQGIKVLKIEGKLPTEENIRAGLYPLTRPRLLISRGRPQDIAREWMIGFKRFTGRPVPKKGRR
ncbi:MAG: substrate-binding domain-containing protein [Candidatus Binatia bacterium]